MMKLWRSSSYQSGTLLEKVGGIVKHNSTKLKNSDGVKKEYVNLPLESARRLRWFDNQDLNQIVRSHIREKQELIELNDMLRKILVDKNLVSENEINKTTLLKRMTKTDDAQIVNESVASALLISVQDELENVKEKMKMMSNQSIQDKQNGTDLNDVMVFFHIDEDSDVLIKVDIFEKNHLLKGSGALKKCLQELKESINDHNPLISQSQIIDKMSVLMEHNSPWTELEHYQKENKRLQELVTVMKKNEEKMQLPSEMIIQAQNMCLAAEKETREAKKEAENALAQAAEAAGKEKSATRKLTLALNQIKTLRSNHKKSLKEANERFQAKTKECESLMQTNDALRTELDLKQSSLDALVDERDLLASRVSDLADLVTDLEDRSNQDDHIKQIANELEAQVVEGKQEAKDFEKKLELEHNEKLKLLNEFSKLEDRFLELEKQQSGANLTLRHQLTIANNELDDCKKYITQLENHREALCKKLHVKPDPHLDFQDTRGSGSFGDITSMSEASTRNGLTAIETLYLKNVLLKFIEATVKQNERERDSLLPPVATLLGASPEEYSRLKKALNEASKDTKTMFSFWTAK